MDSNQVPGTEEVTASQTESQQPAQSVPKSIFTNSEMQSKLLIQGLTLAGAAMALKNGNNLTPEQQAAIVKMGIIAPTLLEGLYHLVQGIKHIILFWKK